MKRPDLLVENSKCEEDIRVSYPRPESDDMLGVVTAFKTDGKQVRRHFCPVCGSAISITLDRFPGIRSMTGGTLDDKNKVKLTFSIWCSEGQPWLKLQEGIACFPDYPEGTFA